MHINNNIVVQQKSRRRTIPKRTTASLLSDYLQFRPALFALPGSQPATIFQQRRFSEKSSGRSKEDSHRVQQRAFALRTCSLWNSVGTQSGGTQHRMHFKPPILSPHHSSIFPSSPFQHFLFIITASAETPRLCASSCRC